jgi:hypothetical protein
VYLLVSAAAVFAVGTVSLFDIFRSGEECSGGRPVL